MRSIKELAQDILCTIEHGECFYEKDDMADLIEDVQILLARLRTCKIKKKTN